MPHPSEDEPALTAEIAAGLPQGEIPAGDAKTAEAVRAAVFALWGRDEVLRPLASGSTARVWETGEAVVKLARDEADHFNAGLRATQAVQASGLEAGAPIPTRSGALSAVVTVGPHQWMLALLQRVAGVRVSMHDCEPAAMGQLLAKVHASLRDVDPTGAWTVEDVLGHMERGIIPSQPAHTQRMISSAVRAVRAWYGDPRPRRQAIRGDGPTLFAKDGAISGMIDWGGVRHGSVVDDIGCWTLHGATRSIAEYTAAFLSGYTCANALTADETRAVPLFQQLRLASRAWGVTDPSALRVLDGWMARIR